MGGHDGDTEGVDPEAATNRSDSGRPYVTADSR
jgi:hypothetical protein